MLASAPAAVSASVPASLRRGPAAPSRYVASASVAAVPNSSSATACPGQSIAATVRLIDEHLAPQRRIVRSGDVLYRAGERFGSLFVLTCGFFKIINLSADGRERVASLKFRGDWLGLDGIADGRYTCDAVAMDTGEVWVLPYDALLAASMRQPALLRALHESMSRQIGGDRESLMSVCTLPAEARVAGFLRFWAESLADRGLRSDEISLRMTRAEIGDYLGMTLETVSRTLSKLARARLIVFADGSRRDLRIPDLGALNAFVQAATLAQAPLQ